MHILIVGNVLKDIYLSLDHRTENFEADKNNIKWLNLGFNASKHHYFRRTSSFGGSAVTLEVLNNLGLKGTIDNSNFSFDDDFKDPADAYRYIFTIDDAVSYFTPTEFQHTEFTPPNNPPEYIFIDRSANLNHPTITKIETYLSANPSTTLILYLKNRNNPHLDSLLNRAKLVFCENNSFSSKNLPTNAILLSEKFFKFQDIVEPITTSRIDTLTHLSFYSIAAATILGSFLLNKSIEESFRLARINVEHSTLNSTLTLKELENISESSSSSLRLIAATLMASKKGILAADESIKNLDKKFTKFNIENTPENRRNYRKALLSAKNLNQYINGVILSDETTWAVDNLTGNRIVPGIKVDQGLELIENSHEFLTQGLDDLESRLRKYYELGFRFAKWRACFVFPVSDQNIAENCHRLASYAKKCQSAGFVPIVEPEFSYDGNYSLEDSTFTTSRILDGLTKELKNFKVDLKSCILKCNMVTTGKEFQNQSTPEEVGKATAEAIKNHLPKDFAGVAFLSGGQTPSESTENLAAIIKNGPFPWPITFSFGRALTDPFLATWQANPENNEKACQAFLDRLIANTKII